MDQGTYNYKKYAFWTGVAFVLLLAFAGAIWGAEFVLRQMDLSLQSRADAIFIFLVVAMAFAFYLIRQAASEFGPPVRLHVFRPADLAAKDDVTARYRIVNLPYPINDGMVLTLNERDIRDPAIYADVVAVDRLICSENDGWIIATLELHEPNDFERLGASTEWYGIRDNAVLSPAQPPQPVPVAESPKTLQ